MHKKKTNWKKKHRRTDRQIYKHGIQMNPTKEEEKKTNAMYAIDWTLELCLWLFGFFMMWLQNQCIERPNINTMYSIFTPIYRMRYALQNSRRFNSNKLYFMLCALTLVWLIFIFHSIARLFVIFSFVINGQLHTICVSVWLGMCKVQFWFVIFRWKKHWFLFFNRNFGLCATKK